MIQLKKYWFHILVWTMMLVYLVTAPALYARFFLRDGKPVTLNQDLPSTTDRLKSSADRLDPVILDGQDLYRLWGWAFMQGEVNQSLYERTIVLQSDTRTYFFSTKTATRPDVQTAFSDLKLNLTNSGYTSYIAKEAIPRGTYKIGILFKHKSTSSTYFVDTNKKIIRTANQLVLAK